MGRRAVWILNLDAELEWSGATPAPDILSSLPDGARAAARSLLAPGDQEWTAAADVESEGRAWCPTPSVQARFGAAGITPEPWPDLDVVRAANHRGTWAGLGLDAGDSEWVTSQESFHAHASALAPGTRLRWKRAFTVAGRGHRRVTVGDFTDADAGWIARSLDLGGMAIEPEREVLREWSMHGHLAQDGELRVGRPVHQRTSQGHWVAAEPATDLDPVDVRRLAAEVRRVGEALSGLGYFGPFGIDAMHVKDAEGATRFLPRTEVNARYTLSYPASGLLGGGH